MRQQHNRRVAEKIRANLSTPQTDAIAASPQVDFPVYATTAQVYTVWLRGYPTNAAGDSAYVGVGNHRVEVTGFSPSQWSWARLNLTGSAATLPISNTGLYTVSLWMRDACGVAHRSLAANDRYDLCSRSIWTGGKPTTDRHHPF